MMKRGFVRLNKEDYLDLGYFETTILSIVDDELFEFGKEMSKHGVKT